jgi:hypothetical protein
MTAIADQPAEIIGQRDRGDTSMEDLCAFSTLLQETCVQL